MSLHRLICVVGIVALCIAFALPAFAQWDPGVEGYAQFRYEYSDEADDGDFDARRVRLSWKDEVNDVGTMARVQIDVADLLEGEGQEIDPKDMWVWHPFTDAWSARVGFGDVMFGKDVEYSSSSRLPFERARATTSFFPSEKCLGVFVTFEGQDTTNLVVDLGLIDGMDAWHRGDFEDAESFVVNAEIPFGEASVAGASYMTSSIEVAGAAAAQDGSGTTDLDADVWGVHVRYEGVQRLAGLAFQGEYYDGDWYDHRAHAVYDADGWYATVEYTPDGSNVTPFYRYDEFNYSWPMHTDQEGGNEAEYSRHTFGVAYEPWDSNRLTLQIEDIDMESGDDTTVGVQWQVKYK